MANIIIEQQPLFKTLPVGQDIIFSVSENNIVANETMVKFIAKVYVSEDKSQLSNESSLVAFLKTTPNNAGVGMFDLRQILESYVSPDYLGTQKDILGMTTSTSTYKTVAFSADKQFPVHLIDKCALGVNTTKWVSIRFKIEYLGANNSYPNTVSVATDFTWSADYLMFNGYVKNEDTLYADTGDFGLNLYREPEVIQYDNTMKFLTNAPVTQYARLGDYGTVAFFNMLNSGTYSFTTGPLGTTNTVYYVKLIMYDSSGSVLATELLSNFTDVGPALGGGAGAYSSTFSYSNLVYIGAYPANFDNWITSWDTHKANVSYYTLQAFDDNASPNPITQIYTVNIICDSSFGYEGVRLAWLNQWGAWDYYTFNQKSVRSINTNKTTYTQLGGTWNDVKYSPNGFRGGKKNFRVNSKERIKLNTDYLLDQDSTWFEELINSPEVYIINSFSTDFNEASATKSGIINKYVEPVLLTTSNWTKKTKANDKLIQYTIEVERNKNQRTQAI